MGFMDRILGVNTDAYGLDPEMADFIRRQGMMRLGLGLIGTSNNWEGVPGALASANEYTQESMRGLSDQARRKEQDERGRRDQEMQEEYFRMAKEKAAQDAEEKAAEAARQQAAEQAMFASREELAQLASGKFPELVPVIQGAPPAELDNIRAKITDAILKPPAAPPKPHLSGGYQYIFDPEQNEYTGAKPVPGLPPTALAGYKKPEARAPETPRAKATFTPGQFEGLIKREEDLQIEALGSGTTANRKTIRQQAISQVFENMSLSPEYIPDEYKPAYEEWAKQAAQPKLDRAEGLYRAQAIRVIPRDSANYEEEVEDFIVLAKEVGINEAMRRYQLFRKMTK